MAEDMGDRTELPTSRRLAEARGRGQIPKSTDLSAALDLIGALIILMILGGTMARASGTVMRGIFENLDTSIVEASIEPSARFVAWELAKIIFPFLGLVMLVGVLAQYLQVGTLFTTQALEPKWTRLNPFTGLGQLFSRRNLVKTVVNSLKCAVILGVGYSFLGGVIKSFAALPVLTAGGAMEVIGKAALRLTLWLLAILLILGIIDWMYQKWQHRQDLRMTKADVKDERRSMEGDPHIKSARLKMAQKIAMQRINSAVPKADVIVTNPTHFSVAIKYDSATMRAPKVVAKGADFLAFKIREVAIVHGVPIVEKPVLARALYAGVDVGREVKPEHYQAVAEVLAFVYRMEQQQAA